MYSFSPENMKCFFHSFTYVSLCKLIISPGRRLVFSLRLGKVLPKFNLGSNAIPHSMDFIYL